MSQVSRPQSDISPDQEVPPSPPLSGPPAATGGVDGAEDLRRRWLAGDIAEAKTEGTSTTRRGNVEDFDRNFQYSVFDNTADCASMELNDADLWGDEDFSAPSPFDETHPSQQAQMHDPLLDSLVCKALPVAEGSLEKYYPVLYKYKNDRSAAYQGGDGAAFDDEKTLKVRNGHVLESELSDWLSFAQTYEDAVALTSGSTERPEAWLIAANEFVGRNQSILPMRHQEE